MSRPLVRSGTGAGASVYVAGRPEGRLADPHSLSPRLRRRRALTLVLLTLLVPGSAQLAAGAGRSRLLGRVGIRAWLLLWTMAGALGLLFLADRSLALGAISRGWVLGLLEWALLALALLWAVLFADAWRLGQPGRLRRDARRLVTGLTAALLVLTSGGLVYAAGSVGAGQDALNALFRGDRAVEPTDGRYNLLLLGADTGRSRVGTRPDSIQLASVDADTGRAVTFGFSRDTENINFRPGSVMDALMPEGWNCGDECLLNGLYTWAEDNRSQFPPSVVRPGITATREAVEALSGLDVHYYVMVDLTGFTQMIDAVGGLDLTVKRRTPIGGGTSRITGWIEPGTQHLDGYHALWYARSREGSTNYERMARQRCVMTAMVDQLDPQTVLLRFQKIASATSGLVQTDLPQSELGYFTELVTRTRAQKITSVNFVPPLIKPWDYDPTVVTSMVRQTIEASERSKEKAVARPRRAPSTPGTLPSGPAAPRGARVPSPAGASAAGASPRLDPKDTGGSAAEADLNAVCSAAP